MGTNIYITMLWLFFLIDVKNKIFKPQFQTHFSVHHRSEILILQFDLNQ